MNYQEKRNRKKEKRGKKKVRKKKIKKLTWCTGEGVNHVFNTYSRKPAMLFVRQIFSQWT